MDGACQVMHPDRSCSGQLRSLAENEVAEAEQYQVAH
jgi:hypothetical protein